jgi:hypothetical protein
MKKHGEAFVGIDTANTRNAVAIAGTGRRDEIRYLGEYHTAPDAVVKLVRRLADRYEVFPVDICVATDIRTMVAGWFGKLDWKVGGPRWQDCGNWPLPLVPAAAVAIPQVRREAVPG